MLDFGICFHIVLNSDNFSFSGTNADNIRNLSLLTFSVCPSRKKGKTRCLSVINNIDKHREVFTVCIKLFRDTISSATYASYFTFYFLRAVKSSAYVSPH